MHVDGAFDFSSSYAVPAYIHDIVYTAGDPVVTIFIATATIACEI
jgi:hypothetical protein